MSESAPHFLVAGAGLGGALMAIYLGQAGYEVDVYERRPDPRAHGAEAGRSINLAFSLRGIHALEQVGVAERVLERAVPMRGRMMHAIDGSLRFQTYGTNVDHVINSVSRGELNQILIEAADSLPNVRLHFGRRCRGLDPERGTLTIVDLETDRQETTPPGIVVGADGAFSAVRSRLQRVDRFQYEQSYLEHGYKELTIPALADGQFALEPNALHIWPRGGFMTIALPNVDGSFTVTLFWPFEGSNGFAALRTEQQIVDYFGRMFPDAVSLMPTLVEDYQQNPASSLVTIRCSPWHIGGRVVLLGDASHAVVPFYGQGANAAFEDCYVLAQCLEACAPDWPAAFARYQRARKANADALADLAITNFIEMRDRVASPVFLARKGLEKMIHRAAPSLLIPLYAMVAFSHMPYAEAKRRGERQDRWLNGVLVGAPLLLVIVLAWAILQ